MDQAQYSCLEIDTEQRVWSVQLHDVMLQLVNVRVYIGNLTSSSCLLELHLGRLGCNY